MKPNIFRTLLVIAFGLFTLSGIASENPDSILNAFREKALKVHDYKAKISIKVDVDFINIKERKGVVFFEQPDQFKFSAGGFALLPRKGMEMEYLKLLQSDYTAIAAGKKEIRGKKTQVIKVIPNSDSTDIVLARMYITPDTKMLYRVISFTKSSGNNTVDFYYADHPYDLPDKLVVEFDIKNQKLPVSLTGDLEAIGKEMEEEQTRGKVIINYSDYEVNRKK